MIQYWWVTFANNFNINSSLFLPDLSIQGTELEPEFDGTITNVTFPAGREAVLTCSVKNLDKYKVRDLLSVIKFGAWSTTNHPLLLDIIKY